MVQLLTSDIILGSNHKEAVVRVGSNTAALFSLAVGATSSWESKRP